jgi:sulfate adenylyltransferase
MRTAIKFTKGIQHMLTPRQLCDYECIANKSFRPLETFLNHKDYKSVVNHAHLENGKLWPIPNVLDISKETKDKIEQTGQPLILRDSQFNFLAKMDVLDIFKPDYKVEARKVFGGDAEHPAVQYEQEEYCVSGPLTIHQLPIHHDYTHLRLSPDELDLPSGPVVAFQTRNPMHRAHMELASRAAASVGGTALIHPVVGLTKAGDIDYHTRIKCYQEIIEDGHLLGQPAILSLLPLAMRMGGPREALWHALIRQNYGATHFILGRDHAGPGSNSKGEDFYGPYEARDFALEFQDELDIQLLPFEMMAYVAENDTYMPMNSIPDGINATTLSGTEVRRRLQTGEDIPSWFTPPKVVEILRKSNPPKSKRGITMFFTGLSGSGKSAIVNGVTAKLHEKTFRPVTVLDGDDVRTFLSSELGFSKEHRDLNIKRIGYVSSLVSKAGGVVLTAAIAPYRKTRDIARELVENVGGDFVEVFVDASVETCESRDVKGLYKAARSGKIPNFTGISDPYEEPLCPDLKITTNEESLSESVDKIIQYLQGNKYI